VFSCACFNISLLLSLDGIRCGEVGLGSLGADRFRTLQMFSSRLELIFHGVDKMP
jgi:hypothetical protein